MHRVQTSQVSCSFIPDSLQKCVRALWVMGVMPGQGWQPGPIPSPQPGAGQLEGFWGSPSPGHWPAFWGQDPSHNLSSWRSTEAAPATGIRHLSGDRVKENWAGT